MYICNSPNCSISKRIKREWNSCINTYSPLGYYRQFRKEEVYRKLK
ncbi:hypothetical protein M078_4799 [Bacteroides fragilis str. 2-F-2 |nr:hypothetical protein M078_4799 [Bacteroides fragilis str. 2-F-2 \